MSADPRRAALDFLAALTNDEFDALAREARDPAAPAQLTRADLAGMTPDAIVEAQAAGRFDTLLGVPQQHQNLIARATALAPVSRADLAELNRIGRHDLAAGYAPHLDRVTD